LHELGHFIPARLFGARVEKFYLFFNPGFSLWKKKIGETEYGIGWIPFGGYVKIAGMIDESMDKAQLKLEPQPWEFRSKPAWQRLIVMLGGIIVNILLAWVIYTIMYATVGQKYIATEKIQEKGLAFGEIGEKVGFKNGDKIVSVDGLTQPNFNWQIIDVLLGDEVVLDRNGKKVVLHLTDEQKGSILGSEGKNFIKPRLQLISIDSVTPNSEAAKAKLQKGDVIKALNGTKFSFFDVFAQDLAKHKNDSITLSIERNKQLKNIRVKVNAEGKLGFVPAFQDKLDFQITTKLSLAQAIPAAVKESWQMLVYNVKQFKLILKPKTEAYKQVKSPLGIARQLPDTWDWEFIWNFTALFSIGLAFMNLLPIPGLDGGHALFTIVEMVTGKKLSDKAAGYVQTAGMVILLSLMALTFGKDIYQWIVEIISKK